ncbi:MFS transporter [Rhodococcus sp. NPDC057529]|uniref:MFS transporter n=1 Tax=Rhodococcus sp. NPDC057529 TaxID=3346158 RepID=UPI00366A9F80
MTVTPTDPTTAGRTHPTAILAIILFSYFMILLDNSIIFTGLPTIGEELNLSPTGLSWVQDAYTLVFGGLLLLGARLGGILGRRRVFVAGLAVFAVASLLVSVAPTGASLIAARALQGIGAAIVAPSSLSLLTASFPEGRERTRAVAWYGAAAGIGASLGLVIGGALTSAVSWRAGFFVNVPIGIAMIVLSPRYLPQTARISGRFDVVGALAATLGMSALVFAIVESAEFGWSAPSTLVALAAGVALLAVLVFNESRVAHPIMPLHLFASRVRTGAYLARMLYLGAMIGFFFFTTQFLQGVLGYSALQAGVAFFPMTVVNFVVALTIPRLTRRVGNATLLTAGVLLTLVGMAWLSRVDAGSAYLSAVALPMVLIGAGQGLAFAPLTAAGISGVDQADAGAASGLVNTAHQLGSALGLGILVAVSTTVSSSTNTFDGLAQHVSTALTAGAGLLALALAVTLALILPAGLNERRCIRGDDGVASPHAQHSDPVDATPTGARTR